MVNTAVQVPAEAPGVSREGVIVSAALPVPSTTTAWSTPFC
jgi:hypothetical protein